MKEGDLMRNLYLTALKECFNKELIHCERRSRSTHAEMARILAMDVRSYADLDHGKSCCSNLTLARYLVYCCDDPKVFLDALEAAFEQVDAIL